MTRSRARLRATTQSRMAAKYTTWWAAALVWLVASIPMGMSAMRPAVAQQPRSLGNAVPVSVAKVERQDVPRWLRGLGSVQALNTVQVRTRVDGTLQED